MTQCRACPRNCGVNRTAGETGFCRETAVLRVASACLHFGEEPPITGKTGSGAIFVTGCNLRCAYCQNYQISQNGMGRAVDIAEFAEICLDLQNAGAENINIVTGSHAIPALASGIEDAKKRKLVIPVCWNSSAYETPEALSLRDGLVDIWLPDLKTLNKKMSASLFAAENYPGVAKEAIRYMLKKAPLVFDSDGKMTGGVIIRHLFLPGTLDDTIRVLDWLKKNADGKAIISLMSQYTPIPFTENETRNRQKALSAFENRLVSPEEFGDLQDLLEVYQFENLYYQELTQDTDWLPDFKNEQPFSNALAKPVWHWSECGNRIGRWR
jgi:putative pyruvate formate lyase activating enzyme